MIREAVQAILAKFDSVMMDSVVRLRLRDENLARFGELAYEDIRRILAEVEASDSRISLEERNRGFFISFKNNVLFRVGVNVFTDRAEIKVDGERVVIYRGWHDSSLENYGPNHKVSLAIKTSILAALHNTLGNFLKQELNKL
jgi:hypothetical protein